MLIGLVMAVALVGPVQSGAGGEASVAGEPQRAEAKMGKRWLWLLPMAGAMVADQVSTERALAVNRRGGWKTWEANPLPGMNTLGGRLAWGLGEAGVLGLAVHSQDKRFERAGKVGAVMSALVHGYFAVRNERLRGRILQAGGGGR
jgi:hypothetical protein